MLIDMNNHGWKCGDVFKCPKMKCRCDSSDQEERVNEKDEPRPLIISKAKSQITTLSLPFSIVLYPIEMAQYAHLLATNYKQLIADYLAEDVPSFDYGGYVVGEDEQVAILYCKAEGVVAGVPFFDEVFKQLDCRYNLNFLFISRSIYPPRN